MTFIPSIVCLDVSMTYVRPCCVKDILRLKIAFTRVCFSKGYDVVFYDTVTNTLYKNVRGRCRGVRIEAV